MSQPEPRPVTARLRPTLDDFIFEGESTPLLLQRRVVLGVMAAFVALVVAYIAVSRALGVSYDFDPEPFRDWVEARGPWAPAVFVLATALSVLFAPIPNAPIFIAAGLAWGPYLGTTYSMTGMMLGSVMAFYTSRFFGRRHLPRLIGHRAAARMDGLAEHMGGRLVFWARMLPIVNFDWVSFVAGLTSIRFWPFFLFSFLGMLIPTSVGVVAGDGLGHDIRITIAAAALWLGAIAGSAAYFWHRQSRWKARQAAARSAE